MSLNSTTPHDITPDNSDRESICRKDSLEDKKITTSINSFHTDIIHPYHIMLSPELFDHILDMLLPIRGTDTLGFSLELNNQMNCVKLLHCIPCTSAAKIPIWRSTIKNIHMTKLNDVKVTSITQLDEMIRKERPIKEPSLTFTISTVTRTVMHPIYGVPQLDHDQLNVIAEGLDDINAEKKLQRNIKDKDNFIRILITLHEEN